MFQSVSWKQSCSAEVALSDHTVICFLTGLASLRSGLYTGIIIADMKSEYTRCGGGVPLCKRVSLLYTQSPVCCFPFLQSSHVGRILAEQP